jgi:hypothetical protein
MQNKPRKGRPPKSPDARRDSRVIIPVTAAEREQFIALAGQAGMQTATWARQVLKHHADGVEQVAA